MHVPDPAACNEAVILAKKRGFCNLSGFVNGVLRALIRSKENLPLPDQNKEPLLYMSVRYSTPEWLVDVLMKQYGREKTQKMLEAFLQVRPMTIRTCLAKTTPEALRQSLEAAEVTVKEGRYFPFAFQISGFNYLQKIPAFREGLFVVQDESSMFPVQLADIQEGDRVLDVCAAPGGKTFHAADYVGESGKVIARDLTEYKTDLLQENNARMQYEQVTIEQWDARKPMDELVVLQREILSVVWQYVRPGGKLIFSTCTLNQKENEENVRWIEEHTPLRAVSIEDRLPERLRGRTGEKGFLQLLPGVDDCDGFFAAKFIRQ